jgi:archaellum component FlaC
MSNAQRYLDRMERAQEHRQMRDEYHRMEERVSDCETERDRLEIELGNAIRELADAKDECDRLRAALEAIAALERYVQPGSIQHGLAQEARAALQEAGDE